MKFLALAATLVASALVATAPAGAQSSVDLPHLFPAAARATGISAVRWVPAQSAYLFSLRDASGAVVVEYRLPIGHPHLQRGVLRVEETTTGVAPIDAGGLSYRTANPPAAALGALISPYDLAYSAQHDPLHTGTLLSHSLDAAARTVTLHVRDSYLSGGTPVVCEKRYALRLFGRALRIEASSDETVRDLAAFNHAGFVFGDGTALPAGGVALHVPYADMIPVFVASAPSGQRFAVARFLDWYASNASETPSVVPSVTGSSFRGETGSAYYRDGTNRLVAPIRETAWVVVAPRILDTLPVIDRPRSEYRLLCAERDVSQNGPGNRYDKARDWVVRARGCGIDDMQHIKWDWHKWPFNLNDPDYLPALPAPPFGTIWGTASDWLAFAQANADGGWGLAPYLAANMMDPGYPNLVLQVPGSVPGSIVLGANPAYDQSLCTRDANGALKKGWDTNLNLANTNLAGQGHLVDVQAPHTFAAKFASIAQGIAGPGGFLVGGAHVDAQTDVPAWIEIDQVRGSPASKTIAQNLVWREVAFQTLKDAMQGPLHGENSHWRYRAFESFAAGVLDGTSRKIPIHWSPAQGPPDATNRDYLVVPDYELGVVLRQSAAWFGMGWEYHFAGSAYPVPQSWSDGWHTTLLSYGHAPYFSTNGDVTNNYWNWRDTLRSHFLAHGLSAALRRDPPHEVRYEDGTGVERTLDEAVAAGMDLVRPRLVLRNASGLEVKLNHSLTTWSTAVRGTVVALPTDGFAGSSPSGLFAMSALNPSSGQRVDYAFEPGVSEMLDPRGVAQSFNGFPGALLPIPPGVLPAGTSVAQVVVVRDLRRNQAVYANGFSTGTSSLGAVPSLVALRIDADDTSTLSLGRLRIGLRAIAVDQNGAERDVTGIVQWSSAHPSVASVGRQGAVRALGLGRATIHAVLAPGLAAQHVVFVDANPQLGALDIEALSSRVVVAAFSTDSHCPLAALLVEEVGVPGLTLDLASPDPVGKLHRSALLGLRRGATYRLTPAALNAFGLAALGTPLVVTVP